MSPMSRCSAMSRSRRRLLLPERVLGSSTTGRILARLGDRADLVRDVVAQAGDDVVAGVDSLAQDDERDDALTGGVIGRADDGGLGDPRVRDERALDLGGRNGGPETFMTSST